MNLKSLERAYICDIETVGFIEDIKSFDDLHVLSVGYKNSLGEWCIKSTKEKEDIQKLFGNKDNIIVMHNGVRYDKPVLEKMGIVVNARIVDSLSLSWNLLPNRLKEGKKFGLESFGEEAGIPKPKIESWVGLSYDEYRIRCEEDVKINIWLWEKLLAKGKMLYEGIEGDFVRLVNILDFIMLCAHKQEVQGLYVDLEKLQENLSRFEALKEEKTESLSMAMPKIPNKVTRNRPKVMYKKDGSLSKSGEDWIMMCKQLELPLEYDKAIEIVKSWEIGNPNSTTQKKEWLYKLGWKPETYKYNRNKETGEIKKVEQILTEDKEICPSVKKLAKVEPAINDLDGLSVLTHRIGLLRGILSSTKEDGMIVQGLQSLAVTGRWMHRTLVNLPRFTGVGDIRDGKWIRECLVAPKGYKIVQADLSGIESRTSDHYTYHINYDRIVKTQKPFYDPHCEISVSSGLMSSAEETFFIFKNAKKDDDSLCIDSFSDIYLPTDEVKSLLSLPEEEQKELIKNLKNVRSKGKTTNYASLYLVGAQTLARSLEISKDEAQKLIDAYWKIHFAVLEATKGFKTKEIDGETWVFNPISKFYYNVRDKRQIFSVINQSSAVYCFNMWVYFISKRGHWAVTQTHDDLALLAKEEEAEVVKQVFHDAMDDLNKHLNLNVQLACDSQIGDNLAETH